jgi:Lon protease-like protein
MSDDQSALAQFDGTARLFPLPNLVLFPHAVQPLHIFEPRYRQLLRDALAGDRLIALVLLRPGWEADYEGRPAVHRVACLGRVLAEERLHDGRYNLLLRGLGRIRIREELPRDTPYRVARAEVLAEQTSPDGPPAREQRRRLARAAAPWFVGKAEVAAEFVRLCQGELELGALGDILSFALPLDLEFKQALLETLETQERVRRLLEYLELHKPAPPKKAAKPAADARPFPPAFSDN